MTYCILQPVCRKSMEPVEKVHGISGQSPWNPWTLSGWSIGTKTLDNFQRIHGKCPWSFSSMSVEFFPVCPWNFSMESMEFFHGIHGLFPQSMEIVQGISGQNPWTMSMEFVQVHCGQNPWTMSMEYFHGHCPLIYSRWLCSVNPEKTFESYCFHAHYGKMHLWLQH